MFVHVDFQGDNARICGEQLLQSKEALVSSTESNMTAISTSLARVQAKLASTNSTLQSDEAQLAALQARVDSQKSTLSAYEGLYLPIGVAVPAVVAVLFAVFYVMKRHDVPIVAQRIFDHDVR